MTQLDVHFYELKPKKRDKHIQGNQNILFSQFKEAKETGEERK